MNAAVLDAAKVVARTDVAHALIVSTSFPIWMMRRITPERNGSSDPRRHQYAGLDHLASGWSTGGSCGVDRRTSQAAS